MKLMAGPVIRYRGMSDNHVTKRKDYPAMPVAADTNGVFSTDLT